MVSAGSDPIGAVVAPNSSQPFVLTFVNGIYHSVDEWRNISHNIEKEFDTEVLPFYNPSSGWWVRDAASAGFDLVLRPIDLDLSKQLAQHLRSALFSVGPHGRVLHVAHSGGAILTYLAAKHHLTAAETGRIDVITLGGGKSITHKYFKGHVANYYARNDPVVMVDNRAARLLRRASSRTMDCEEVRDPKHNTSFMYLAAQARHPIVDHSMLGPTYRSALAREAALFRDRLRALRGHQAKEADVLRMLRKRAARLTGVHHLWDLRRARKALAALSGCHGLLSRKYRSSHALIHREQRMVSEEDLLLGEEEEEDVDMDLLFLPLPCDCC